MTKIAKMREVKVSAPLKRRLSAAICLLLISTLMLVTSTYAWYTISTKPEAKGIGTSVSGNGSLEVALVPGTGVLTSIGSGRGDSGYYGGGNKALTAANITWGNLVSLVDSSYGFDKVTLTPVGATVTNGVFSFSAPEFGYDGRIIELDSDSALLKSYNASTGAFDGSDKGVRGLVSASGATSAYGYVIDLALRINTQKNETTPAALLLTKEGAQRIYSDSDSEVTSGGGSYVEFTGASGNIGNGLRLAFIQNFIDDDTANQTVLAYAKADAQGADGKCRLQLYSNIDCTTPISENKLVAAMTKNAVYQISVVVWLDGSNAKNSDFAISDVAAGQVKLNLQFATDAALTPMLNTDVRDNPEASKGLPIVTSAIGDLASVYGIASAIPQAARPAAVQEFIDRYEEEQGKLNNNEYDTCTAEEGNAVKTELEDLAAKAAAAIAALNP